MVATKKLEYFTAKYNEMIPIKKEVAQIVEDSPVKQGVVYVITHHTTTGIMVNENLECLDDYGAMAGNPTGHLKAMVSGNHCVMPVEGGKLVSGSAQEIYLAEFDGPQERTVSVIVMGE